MGVAGWLSQSQPRNLPTNGHLGPQAVWYLCEFHLCEIRSFCLVLHTFGDCARKIFNLEIFASSLVECEIEV